MSDLILRDQTEADEPFIFSSWLKSFRLNDRRPGPRYYREQHNTIERLLKESSVKVACLAATPHIIIGWSAINGQACHYVYVKSPFRRMGIARTLLASIDPTKTVTYSHKTERTPDLFRHFKRAEHRPCVN